MFPVHCLPRYNVNYQHEWYVDIFHRVWHKLLVSYHSKEMHSYSHWRAVETDFGQTWEIMAAEKFSFSLKKTFHFMYYSMKTICRSWLIGGKAVVWSWSGVLVIWWWYNVGWWNKYCDLVMFWQSCDGDGTAVVLQFIGKGGGKPYCELTSFVSRPPHARTT